MKVKSEREVTQSCPTLRDPMDCSLPDSSVPWVLPGKSTGVECHLILLSTTTINLAKGLYYDMSPFLWFVYISKFAELPLIFSCIVPPLSFFKLLHKTCLYLILMSVSQLLQNHVFLYYKYSSTWFPLLTIPVIKISLQYFALWCCSWDSVNHISALPASFLLSSANRRCQRQSTRIQEEEGSFSCWFLICFLFLWASP